MPIGRCEIYRSNGENQRSKEFYEFTIDKPGTYRVKAVAKFRIEQEQQNDVKLTSFLQMV